MSRFIKPLFKWEAILMAKYMRWVVIPLFAVIAALMLISGMSVDLSENRAIFLINTILVYLGAIALTLFPTMWFSNNTLGEKGALHHLVGCPYLLIMAVRAVYACILSALGVIAFMFQGVISHRFNMEWDMFYVFFQVNITERIPWAHFIGMIYVFGICNHAFEMMWESFAHKYRGTSVKVFFTFGGIATIVLHVVLIMVLFYALEGFWLTLAIIYAIAVPVTASIIGARYYDNKIDLGDMVKL